MSRHLMAKMQFGAGLKNAKEIDLSADSFHEDWRNLSENNWAWHPYAGGDTHAKYRIFPYGGGPYSTIPQRLWKVNHHGVYQSKQELAGEDGTLWKYPEYSLRKDPELVGDYSSLEEAQEAAHEHFRNLYRKRSSPEIGQPLKSGNDNFDDDYGDIFGDQP